MMTEVRGGQKDDRTEERKHTEGKKKGDKKRTYDTMEI